MEITIAIIIFLLATIGLSVAIGVDIIEYRRYRKASFAVLAFGAAMQEQFKIVAENLERVGMENVVLSQLQNRLAQEQIFINNIVKIHSQALGLGGLVKAYQLHEESESAGKIG